MRLERLPGTSVEKDFASHVMEVKLHSPKPESSKCQDHDLCYRIISGDSH